jgi:enoyl-CoA hydratase/carnithine racemase
MTVQAQATEDAGDDVVADLDSNGLMRIELNRPHKLNAVDVATLTRLLAFCADKVPAQDAFDCRMISHQADDAEYEEELTHLIGAIAAGPAVSYDWTKRALAAGSLSALSDAHSLEGQGQWLLTRNSDFAEGGQAFRQRRPPRFMGR